MKRNSAALSMLAAAAAALAAYFLDAQHGRRRRAAVRDGMRMLGRPGPRSIDLARTVHIESPPAAVFAFWSDFENLPRFMRNVLEVRRNADQSWRWKVAGPMGAAVEWDTRVTQVIRDEVIAWATKPGAAVEHAGIVRLRPGKEGGARVHVRMSYRPAAGALGHAVASLFGADPDAEMNEDLMRLKAHFEAGKPARDAALPY